MKDKKIEQMKESSAMRKKRIAKNLFLAVCSMFLAGSVTGIAVACDEGTPPPVIITEGQETGVYYFADGEQEYMLTLNSGNLFTIVGGNANRSGSYTIADGALTFSFIKIGEEETITMTGTLEGDVLTVNYGESATRFLKKVNYTVSFETNGAETTVEAVTVMNGKTIVAPATPTKTGKTFAGWYVDEDCETPFYFGSTLVTGNTTLYAKWVDDIKGQKEYVVDFDLGYEAENPVAKTTVEGKIYGVITPERQGYTFAGWWIGYGNDAEKLSYEWTKDKVFDANTTLYALWTKKPEGGKLSAPIVRVSGTNISWDNVENAQNYELTIVNATGRVIRNTTVGSTSYNFDFGGEAAGEYKITVKALASDTTKNSEETVRYYANKMLTRVSQFSVIEPSVLVFNPVENAEGYLITVQCGTEGHVHTQFYNGPSTTYNFANCDAKDGVISFIVTAVADGYASSVSETYTHVRSALGEVKGLYVDENTETLVWEAVEGATNYVVEVACGNEEHVHIVNNGTKTSYSLKECEAVVTEEGYGDIVITVRAEAKGYSSAEATEFTYNKTKLSAPNGFKLQETVLTWNEVPGATGYIVRIGAQTFDAETNSMDLASTGVNWVGGETYQVSVRAKSETNESVYSDVISVNYYAMGETISYKNGTVVWKPVIGAKVYEVKVNDEKSVRISNGEFSMPVTFTSAGVHTISVRYYDGEAYSDWASTQVVAHEILFDSRGGESAEAIYKANGDTIVLPTSSKSGYVFDGWYNAPGGAAGNGAKFDEGTLTVTGSVALYASWSPAKLTVVYNANHESASMVAQQAEVVYTKNFTLEVPTNTNEDLTFVGWFTEPNGLENTRLTDQYGVGVDSWNIPEGATAYAYWANVLKFKQREDGTYAVSKGTDISKMKEVKIPAYYKGQRVTLLDAYSFQYASKLEKISIPNTIELVENNVFYACNQLSWIEVYTPEDVDGNYDIFYESVDGILLRRYAEDMSVLEIYTVPAAITGKVTIPEGVTEIPMRVFTKTSVSEIVIPSSVKMIRQNAFQNCTSLKSITFLPTPEGATEEPLVIQKDAFKNCTNLTMVSLPKRLNDIAIDEEAGIPTIFTGCVSLAYVHIEQGNLYYASVDGMLTTTDQATLLYCPIARAGSITIDSKIMEIAPNAFINCERITEVIIPGSIDKIGVGAFASCDRLKSVYFAETDGVGSTIISANAFVNCGALKQVIFHENSEVSTIGDTAFANCTSIKDMKFPKSLTSIGTKAFSGCKSMAKLEFAEDGASLSLGDYAFENCLTLSQVTLPACVNELALGAFNGCASLAKIFVSDDNMSYCDVDGIVFTKDKKEILYYSTVRTEKTYELPAETERIAGAVFKNNKVLTSFVIPARVSYVGESAFDGCTSIKTMTIEQGDGSVPLTIGKSAFKGMTNSNFKNLVFPNRTVSIGEMVCYSCNKLESITLPTGLTVIPTSAFQVCTKLASITIPSTVTSIGDKAFTSCTSLVSTAIYPLVIPEGVVSIGASAFSGCSKLEGVQLPATLQNIGASAFSSCTKLTTINLPASITEIPASLFASCSALVNFEIPANITSIGASAFKSTKLKQIVIPASVTSIGDSAFASISTLVNAADGTEAVTFAPGSNLTTLAASVFQASGTTTSTAKVSITIPKSVTTISDKAFYTAKFREIVFEDGGTADLTIGVTVFDTGSTSASSSYLTSITLPDRLVSIGKQAFYRNMKLTTVNIGENSRLATIGMEAFSKCTALKNIYIPKSVHDVTVDGKTTVGIGNKAFNGMTALETITFAMDNYGANDEKTQLTISTEAFGGSTKITSVKFPSRLISIDSKAFQGCTNLASFEVEEGGVIYSAQDGILYSADKSVLYMCPVGKVGEVVVPNTVTLVKALSFYQCKKITKVTFTDAEEGSSQMADGMYLGDGSTNSASGSTATVFGGCSSLTEVILPNYLKGIGSYAFQDQLSNATKKVHPPITSITLPASLEYIESFAFYYMVDLAEVHFAPDGKLREVGRLAFAYSGLETLEIASSIENISEQAFTGLSNLASLTFAPNSNLKSIGASAFANDKKLSGDVVFPESLEGIDANVFRYCTLDSIYIPSKVVSLTKAFDDLTASEFIVNENNPTYVSKEGVLYSRGTNTNGVASLEAYPRNRGMVVENDVKTYTITSYTVLEGTTSIAQYAFDANPALKEIVIPKTVSFIGTAALRIPNLNKITFQEGGTELEISMYALQKTKLTEINFPRHLKSLGTSSVSENTLLKTVTFTEGCNLETIGDTAFTKCTQLTGIILPNNVSAIGKSAFTGCTVMKTATFNNGLQTIGASAFKDTAVQEVVLPNSLTEIGESAFENVPIQSLTLSNQLTVIPAKAFKQNLSKAASNRASFDTLVLPDSVTTVNQEAFYGCTALETITFSSTIEIIGNYAFYKNGFTEIIVPNTVRVIGNSAFEDCANVAAIELRDGVQMIGDSAFAGCTKVKVMQLPASLEVLGSDPFRGIVFETFGVDPNNTSILLENGIMYDSTKETIMKYFGTEEIVTIPYRVTKIGGGAFANSMTVREVILHEDIVYIGDYAFQNCLLEEFTVGEKVAYLGKYAFDNNRNLKKVVFENGSPSLKAIEEGTFKNCVSLNSVNLPVNIRAKEETNSNYRYYAAIGDYAFYGCESLTSIDFSVIRGYYNIGEWSFAYTGLTEIYLDENCSTREYKEHPSEDYDVASYAFYGCENLTKVTIVYGEWDGMTQPGVEIFGECWNLEEVEFINVNWGNIYAWDGDPFRNSPFEGEFNF